MRELKRNDLAPLSTLLRPSKLNWDHSHILPLRRKGRVEKDGRYICHRVIKKY